MTDPSSCLICARIAMIQAGTNPWFVAELATGYVVLGDHQFFRGYTLLLGKAHLPELHDLPRFERLQFLAEMSGVMVLHDGAVVCEAATGAAVAGRSEVGVTTHAEFRGRGLATAACATLIGASEAEGLATWWDCAAHNAASVRLARRLGFGEGRAYRYLEWQ